MHCYAFNAFYSTEIGSEQALEGDKEEMTNEKFSTFTVQTTYSDPVKILQV